MQRLTQVIQMRTVAGRPISAGGRTITPLARVVMLRLPWGGWAWNRPLAVLVLEDGRVTRIPVLDVTRLGRFVLLGFTMALGIAGGRVAGKRKEHRR